MQQIESLDWTETDVSVCSYINVKLHLFRPIMFDNFVDYKAHCHSKENIYT